MTGFLFKPDRWVSLQPHQLHPDPDNADGVHVRVREQDGRLVITDMYIHAPAITPEILRGISVSRIEAYLNTYKATPGDEVMESLCALLAARLPDDGESEPSLAELRQLIPAPVTETPDRPRLTRPDRTPPDEFYPRVAAAYVEYAPQTRAPAKKIAAEAGVPVTTAHRWIREARRRGFLSAASKGKAG
jgi:hypothetical protein